MLEFGKTHFYHNSLIAHWRFWSNFGQTRVVLVWYPSYLKSKCFNGNVQEVLRFVKIQFH